jgi:hypothetical protein
MMVQISKKRRNFIMEHHFFRSIIEPLITASGYFVTLDLKELGVTDDFGGIANVKVTKESMFIMTFHTDVCIACFNHYSSLELPFEHLSLEEFIALIVGHELGHCKDSENVLKANEVLLKLDSFFYKLDEVGYQALLNEYFMFKLELEKTAWRYTPDFLNMTPHKIDNLAHFSKLAIAVSADHGEVSKRSFMSVYRRTRLGVYS